ncbi:MAG: chromosome segregation protein SMC [Zetaproteobacteria bacterium]|nr:chromosome segregation protein SMC [Pseudobdellovibrionaceae bacterium]
MYLKKIVLNGFKSFADRVTLSLDQKHISGIVGPNGSGKSNIIDAVRWVMGEQNSKMLRGEKATDIIFSGSEKRKPLGMAEVILVFDNSEASDYCPPEYRHETEVTLCRRIYKDGQREYLINKKQCRLKDIVGFFAATGLGGRSYSMIQQGQVERILQAKPEELREIIEEAAGTLIFKRRRLETEKKLEATRVNLNRIQDLLNEIEGQKNNLKDQAKKAQQWKDLQDKLQETEQQFACQSYLSYRTKEKSINDIILEQKTLEASLLGDLSGQEKEQKKIIAEIEKANPEVASIRENIAQVRENLVSNEVALQNAVSLLESGSEKLLKMEDELLLDTKNINIMQEQYDAVEKEYLEAKKDVEEHDQFLEKKSQTLQNLEEKSYSLEHKIKDHRDNYAKDEKSYEANKIQLNHIEEQRSKLKRENEIYLDKISSFENNYSQLRILIDSYQIKVSNCQKNITEYLEQKKVLDKKVSTLLNKEASVNDHIQLVNNKIIELSTYLAYLKNPPKKGDSELSTYTELKSKGSFQDFYLMTDCLVFNEDSEVEAPSKVIESFENWAQRVVCSDLSTAKNFIAEAEVLDLKNIPLSFCGPPSEKLHNKRKSWAEKFDLLSIQPLVKNVSSDKYVDQILSRIFYCLEPVSKDIIISMPDHTILILSNGGVLNSSSDWSIGGFEEESILKTKKTILSLEEQISSLKDKIKNYNEDIKSSHDKRKKLAFDIEEIDNNISSESSDQVHILNELKISQEKANDSQKKIVELRSESKDSRDLFESVEDLFQDLKKQIDDFEKEKRLRKNLIEDLEEEQEATLESLDEIKLTISEKKLRFVTSETKYTTYADSLKQTSIQLKIFKDKNSVLDKNYHGLKGEIHEASQNQKYYLEAIKDYSEKKEDLDRSLAEHESNHSDLSKKIKLYDTQLKKLQGKLNSVIQLIAEKKSEKEKISAFIENLVQQTQESLNLDLNIEKIDPIENYNSANAKRQVSSLKHKIDQLGPINMMAIKEFEDLDKRCQFVSAQKEELVSSVDLLELAIEEISETSKNKFLTIYQQLNHEFKGLFPILFPRGEGHIALTDIENPLDSGLEILVRLPGKAQQNMRLFSGGEKALTAIALIFALLKTKPTPYCFLDEVDAALDEANVSRYNRVLDSLSDHFQFIIITHRRGTMEVLDTLYGITMQEPGVSKVVGVDLSKHLPAHLQKSFKERSQAQAGFEGKQTQAYKI